MKKETNSLADVDKNGDTQNWTNLGHDKAYGSVSAHFNLNWWSRPNIIAFDQMRRLGTILDMLTTLPSMISVHRLRMKGGSGVIPSTDEIHSTSAPG